MSKSKATHSHHEKKKVYEEEFQGLQDELVTL